jgi:hypothetical protein
MKEKCHRARRERMEKRGPRLPLPPGAPDDMDEDPPVD